MGMAVPERLTRDEIREMSRGLPPTTADDVSITGDGVRLDSREKVVAFFEQLERERVLDEAGTPAGRRARR